MSTLLLYASCLETFQGTYTILIFFTIFTKLLPLLCHIFKYINKTTYNIHFQQCDFPKYIPLDKNYRFSSLNFFTISECTCTL